MILHYNSNHYKDIMTYTRNYKKWSAEEDDQLQKIYENSRCFKYVANKLSRSIDAVQARYVKMVICAENTIKDILKNRKEMATDLKIDDKDFIRYLKYASIRVDEDDSSEGSEGSKGSEGSEGSEESEGSEGSEGSEESDTDSDATYVPESDYSDSSDCSEFSDFSDSVKEKKSDPKQIKINLRFNINCNLFLIAAIAGGFTAYGIYHCNLLRYV